MVYCNTQGKTDPAGDFAETVARVRAEDPDFVGWQEVNDAEDRRLVELGMGPDYELRHKGVRGVPISGNIRRWEVIDHGYLKAHGGKARTSPARYITWVVARNRQTGAVLVVVNTHFVSGAWNLKPKRNKAWRRRMWRDHYADLVKLLERLRVGPIIFGGDFNRRRVELPNPLAIWLDDRGIDKVGIVADAGTWQPDGAAVRIETPSDHDARRVDLTLVA